MPHQRELLARRGETIYAIFDYLLERLPQFLWSELDVRVPGLPSHVAFTGRHCDDERFACLIVDRRVIDCAGDEPSQLLWRLDLAGVPAELEAADCPRPVRLELD
jgi:hypothetical protein